MNLHITGKNAAFAASDARVRIIIGPIGSGKTVACCAEIMKRAMAQEPHPRDNIRYFRAIIVRNTRPQLRDTVWATWDWMYGASKGKEFTKTEFRHHIKRKPKGSEPGLDLDVRFRAMDTFDDVDNLLSNEPTIVYLNEVRELPELVLVASKDRTGRYPPVDNETGFTGATFHGVIADANPPHHKHWLYKLYDEKPAGHEFFIQDPAVLEVKPKRVRVKERRIIQVPGGYDTEFTGKTSEETRFVSAEPDAPMIYGPLLEPMQSCGRLWAVNPRADNVKNLVWGYYHEKVAGSGLAHIQAYYQGRRVFVAEGKPVIPGFQQDWHVDQHLELLPNEPLMIGVDMGGGTLDPAAVIFQRDPFHAAWLVHDELYMPNTALDEFTETLRGFINQRYPDREVGACYVDPAAKVKGGESGGAYLAHFRAMGFRNANVAKTNKVKPRANAIESTMDKTYTVGGAKVPRFRIHPRCEHLVMGLAGGWHYRQVVTSGEVFKETPEKNEFSHVCDALGYGMLGGGGWKDLKRPEAGARRRGRRTTRAKVRISALG